MTNILSLQHGNKSHIDVARLKQLAQNVNKKCTSTANLLRQLIAHKTGAADLEK
jgi:hypothetical protein